jgi:hypothetical protein
VPLLTLFISDVIINLRYGAPLLDPQILVRYGRAGACRMPRASFAEVEPSLKTLLPASIVASTMFYCHHEHVLVVERSRLREEFCGARFIR